MLPEEVFAKEPFASRGVVGERFLVWTSRVITASPFIVAAGLCGSAAYIRFSFGRWPVFNRDTVHAPFKDLATSVVFLALVALLPLFLAAVLMAAVRWAGRVRPVLGSWALWFIVGWVSLVGLMTSDPVGFVAWALD